MIIKRGAFLGRWCSSAQSKQMCPPSKKNTFYLLKLTLVIGVSES